MSSPDSIPPSIPPESPPSLPPSPPKDRITISIDSTGSNAENPETVLQPSSTVEKNSAIMKRIGRFMAGMLSPGKSIENEYFQQGHDLTIPVRLGRSSSCDLSSRYSIADPNSASMSKTTLSENTMISKISRKLKDIMQNSDQSDSVGLHASATSIALSSTASTDFCAGINNEDEDNSVLDCLSVETGSRQVWLFERTRRSKPFFIRVRPMQSVREIIKMALETVRNNDETYVDPSTWHICKIDPNQLLTLVWFDPHASAAECKINDGDELMIKNEDEEETFQYRIPALKITGVSTFRFGVTVRQALDKILAETNIEPISYGVYHKKIGLWLDEKRDLMSYDIIDSVLEIRELSNEFLIRICLPELGTRFAIKVIPSLTVEDLTSMIHYNLKQRRIRLEQLDTEGNGTLSFTDWSYGIFYPATRSWLENSRSLESYDLKSDGDEVDFKLHYRTIILAIPSSIKFTSGKFESSSKKLWRGYRNNRLIKFSTMAETLIGDIIHDIDSENRDLSDIRDRLVKLGFETTIDGPFAFYSKSGEYFHKELFVWGILDECPITEIFEYKFIRRKIRAICDKEREIELDFDVDLTAPIFSLMPLIWRRFGVNGSSEFSGCRIAKSLVELELNLSLIAQDFRSTDVLLVETNGYNVHSMDSSDEINIWEEPEDCPENILLPSDLEGGLVAAATLNKLVEKLTSADENGTESSEYLNFMKTFLLTYRSFTQPQIFLRKLIERYHVPRLKCKFTNFADYEKYRQKIQLRVCNILLTWMKRFSYDFISLTQSENVFTFTAQLCEFLEDIISDDHPSLGKNIRKYFLRMVRVSISECDQLNEHGTSAKEMLFLSNKSSDPKLLLSKRESDSEELARQLTLREFELFSKIMPHELLNQSWTKEDSDIRSPNIINITKLFNVIALWVAKTIVEAPSLKSRARRMGKLVEIASNLYANNNFSTLMAFIAGFNKASVQRLKHTIKELPSKTAKRLSDLEVLMTAESSYKNYRAKIHAVNPPCIPYIGVYLLDLTYIEDGNPSMINRLINFSKRRLIYTLIREVQLYQDQPFCFQPVEEIILGFKAAFNVFLESTSDELKALDDRLFEVSLAQEPRGADRSQII